MTAPKDIIGLVKELQTMRAYGVEHVHDDAKVSARNVPETEWNYWHRLEKVLPSAAQALLIAVEALKMMDDDSGDEPFSERMAKEALSRIRSLPVE